MILKTAFFNSIERVYLFVFGCKSNFIMGPKSIVSKYKL